MLYIDRSVMCMVMFGATYYNLMSMCVGKAKQLFGISNMHDCCPQLRMITLQTPRKRNNHGTRVLHLSS